MQKLKARISFMALAALTTLALPVFAQVQPNIQVNEIPPPNAILGAPTVVITNVNLFKATNLAQAGIEWAVQKPTLTQLSRFDVAFEVIYQNGKSRRVSKSITDSSARATSFTGLDGFPVESTKTTLTTLFTTPGVLTTSEDFTFNSTSQTPPRPVALDILS